MTVSDVSYRLYCASPIDATMHVHTAMQILENLREAHNTRLTRICKSGMELELSTWFFMRDSCKRRGPPDLLPASAPHHTTCNTTADVIGCASTDAKLSSLELNRDFSPCRWLRCEGMHHVLPHMEK
jgi:hypothetical protein